MIGGVPTSLWKLAKLNILRWGRFHLISALSVDLNYGLICNAISEWSLHEERRPMLKIRLWKKARPQPKNSAMVTWHETGETRINLVQAQQELWQKQGVRCVPKCRVLYVCFLTKNTTYFRGHHYFVIRELSLKSQSRISFESSASYFFLTSFKVGGLLRRRASFSSSFLLSKIHFSLCSRWSKSRSSLSS